MAPLEPHPEASKVAAKVLAGSGELTSFPDHLLADITDLLDIRPYDTLFKLVREPGTGFGKAECLEGACIKKNKIVTLNASDDVDDGGKAFGIGSLGLLLHHQKNSPAHLRAVKSREPIVSDVLQPNRSQEAPKASSSNTNANRGLKSTSSFRSAASNEDKKLILIDSSSEEDDVILVPTKKSNAPSPSKATGETHGPGLASSFPASKLSAGKQDKGKGRAPLQKHSSQSSINANSFQGTNSFTLNMAIPRSLQSENKHRHMSLDSDLEDKSRSDRSSADSDLVDLSSIFGPSAQQKKETQAISTESSQNDRDEILKTAHMRKRPNLNDDSKDGMLPHTGSNNPHDMKRDSSGFKLAGKGSTLNDDGDADKKPATKDNLAAIHGVRDMGSAVPPFFMKKESDKTAGDDSGYLNSFSFERARAPYSHVPAPIASTSNSAAPARHTANLGPVFIPNATGGDASVQDVEMKGENGSEDDDNGIEDDMSDFRRGIEPFSGGERAYTQDETLGFFNDAAAGFDFDAEGEAALEKAMAVIGLEKQGDRIEGTAIQPFAHQILGIAWMVNQEKLRPKIKGGILADDMGLGKTVQTISLIHLHQAKKENKEKATLILAPLALLQQWKNEIERFQPEMKAYIYHGPGRKISRKELKKYDIVLTTTNTMALGWSPCDDTAKASAKRKAKKKGKEWNERDEERWYDRASEQDDHLFTINWRRVIVDESQNLRNRNTKVSRASCYLNATYRWCLTGTPITNSLDDVYSLLRFLRVKPWQDWAPWRDAVHRVAPKYPEKASKKVQAILKLVLLRRNKDSELNGKRLLNLRPMHLHETAVVLSADEMSVYSYIEGRSQQQLSKYIREGTVMKNYAHILVLLLRLRQCVGHPALVTESCLNSAYTSPESVEAERVAAHNSVLAKCGRPALDTMLKRRVDLAKQRCEDEKAQGDIQVEECPICMDPLDASALLTACGHAFCSCIKDWIEQPETAAQNPENFGEEDRPCPSCREKITKEMLFAMQHFEPTADQLEAIAGGQISNDQDEFEKEMSEFLKRKNMKAMADKPEKKNRHKRSRPAAGTSRAAKRRVIVDSDDEDNFIDDSEELNPIAGYTKKTGGESDDEIESDGSVTEHSGKSEDSDGGDVADFIKRRKDKSPELSSGLVNKFKEKSGRKFIPSAKMEAMLRIIKESPKEDKIMIISQWTSMLDLVAAYFNEQAIPWIAFTGSLNTKDRNTAVKRFNESKAVKCMLMSLKAGGVGLNLTGGNRAILLDLAWSPAVEAQAFCRMHRLGQQKEVFVERCVVAGTVEDRMLTLQAHKQKLADHSLGEGSGKKLKKFGIEELKMLFGFGQEQGHFARQQAQQNPLQAGQNGVPPTAGPSNAAGPGVPLM